MARSIKLYWEINNDAIDEAVRKFDILQKKVEEMNNKASQTKNAFANIDESQAAALDAEYKRLRIKEKEIAIEEKTLRLAQQKEKIERQSAKIQEESVKKTQEGKRKLAEQEEKEAQKKIKDAERLAQKQQKEQERLHKAAEAERRREQAHMEKLVAMKQKSAGAGGAGGGGGGGGFSMSGIVGDKGGGMLGGLGNISSLAGGTTAALMGAAAAAGMLAKQLVDVYGAVIGATMETEKLETNLALAYQSASVAGKGYEENLKAAQSAMLRIQELAAKTPFDVNQLTDSYIKLTKRGMRPAEDQLLAIGNLASFSGKSIDQLVEAILDAQQGNKARLKEFGIDMQTEGGKVKLAIGDIKVEGEKIIETFSKLGEMPGIGQAMIRQSQTIQGVFDTLKDNFQQFLSQIGKTPSFFNTIKTAGSGLAVYMEALKKSAASFGNALGEPLQLLVNTIFPNFNKEGGASKETIDKITQNFQRLAEIIKMILMPVFRFLASMWESLNKHIIQNQDIIDWLKTAYRALVIFLQQFWETLKAVGDALLQAIGNLFNMGVAASNGQQGIRKFAAACLATIDIVKDLIIELAALLKLLFSIGTIATGALAGGFTGAYIAYKKEERNIKKALSDLQGKFLDPKVFAENYKKHLAALNKDIVVTTTEEEGKLPGGADLRPSTDPDAKAKKEQQIREKDHNAKIEQERRRHVKAVIAIEEEAVKNREFNETKTRKLAEEAILHEENTFLEQQRFAEEEYKMQRKLTEANVKNGKQEKIDLEFLELKYQHESEKREFEHGNKILELIHKSNQAKLAEHLAFVRFSRKIEENRLDDNLSDLKRSIDNEKAIISANAERFYANRNATNLKLLKLDEQYAKSEYETQKRKLNDKLFDNKLYNNLSIEEELEIKRQLENLEKNHQAKLTSFVLAGEKERLEAQRYVQEKSKETANQIIKDTEDALKKGLGDNIGGGIMNIATLKNNLKQMRETVQREISTLRSIGTKEANDLANILEQKLARDTVKMIATQIGDAASSLISGITDILNKVQELRIAQIDKQIQKNNEEIEQLREKAELERERNEELLRRQEIDNKLARQRIDELTQLQTSIPESEQALAKEQIEIQKRRIKDIEKAKEESENKENARIKQIEAENKRLEEEKIRVQREQFEINRAAQIAQTIIQGAVAAINAFSSLALIPIAGPGLAAAAAASIGVFTAGQVALIAAQPNPYAKGTLNVEGEQKNKDSVPALLMPGEAVIPVSQNKDYHDTIKAIYNREIAPKDLNMFVKNYKMRRMDLDGRSGGSAMIINTLDSKPIIQAIENKPVASVNIDEEGLNVYIEKVGERTKILNKKLRITK